MQAGWLATCGCWRDGLEFHSQEPAERPRAATSFAERAGDGGPRGAFRFNKLNVSSRAAATAYAFEHQLTERPT